MNELYEELELHDHYQDGVSSYGLAPPDEIFEPELHSSFKDEDEDFFYETEVRNTPLI